MTTINWVVRGTNLIRVYGGGLADQLPARGELGAEVKALVDAGVIRLVIGFSITAVRKTVEGIGLQGDTIDGPRLLAPADRIVVATASVPT